MPVNLIPVVLYQQGVQNEREYHLASKPVVLCNVQTVRHSFFHSWYGLSIFCIFLQSISPGLVKTEFRGRLEKRSDPNSVWEDVEGVGGSPVRRCSPSVGDHERIA